MESMIRKELSFSIHNKFNGDSDQAGNLSKENLYPSVAAGENSEDEFSFGCAESVIDKDNDEKDGFGLPDYRGMDSDPVSLRNYAQFLELKGEFSEAEKYYIRSMKADPKDAATLYHYGKLVWELHHDRERAISYFERAALAAPGDSDILAAHASFLWKIDEEEEDEQEEEGEFFNTQADNRRYIFGEGMIKDFDEGERPSSPPLHLALGLGLDMPSFSTVDFIETGSHQTVEEHYGRMLEENSSNPLFLKDYTNFLREFEGDLQGAEEYYLRKIQEGSYNGRIMSQYANLLWQLHRDNHRADAYFNVAIQATPDDSDVLASYAKFLWEIEDEEEDFAQQAHNQSAEDLANDEGYYSQAMLDNPNNGQIISQYANLLWQLHADKDKADAYFKRAIEATPEDCDVLASYAKFLWETEDGEVDSADEG